MIDDFFNFEAEAGVSIVFVFEELAHTLLRHRRRVALRHFLHRHPLVLLQLVFLRPCRSSFLRRRVIRHWLGLLHAHLARLWTLRAGFHLRSRHLQLQEMSARGFGFNVSSK